MASNNYFFERKEFESQKLKKPHYVYKGYKSTPSGKNPYPVILHFGKDEIVFSFQEDSGKVNRVFSLYVANGEINQNMLTKKIEDYWKMPLWPLNKELCLEVDKTLLSISYFSSFYEFDVKDDEFVKCRLFKRKKKRDDFKLSRDTLQFIHLNKRNKKYLTERDRKEEIWEIEDSKISAHHVNFRKILLDFLFELDYTNTFEDENFFKLQPALQNNKLLDALSRKCRYLDELYKKVDFVKTKPRQELPKQFRDAEKSWLNVYFQNSYIDVFTSADSVFDTVEEEAENVIFKSCIGKAKRSRTKYFTKDDKTIRNQSATFFLRRYAILNAFRVLLPSGIVYFLPLLFLFIPLGDILLFENNLAGLSTVVLPFIMLLSLICYYARTGINLFKLFLPRMFLGIMIGWSVFASTEDMWKAALITKTSGIIALNVVLLIIITLYVFTDIRNKLVRIKESAILRRTAILIIFAMLISVIQGYYVILYNAKPILENSGFLTTDNRKIWGNNETVLDNIQSIESNLPSIRKNALVYENVRVAKDNPDVDIDKILGNENSKVWYKVIPLFGYSKKYEIRVIPSILFSQFIMSILAGIVLQLLWEDRPITEPL